MTYKSIGGDSYHYSSSHILPLKISEVSQENKLSKFEKIEKKRQSAKVYLLPKIV